MDLIKILIVVMFAIYFVSSYIFARMITRSHRQKIVFTPRDHAMDYEDITFESRDGLRMNGWFIPGRLNKTVIVTHPFPFNRHGFLRKNQGWLYLFRTDVNLLTTARALHDAGYNVLMFDFRNHGESAAGITGIGLNEAQDVIGAVDYLKKRFADKAHRIGFVSFCMGADATLIALSRLKDDLEPIKCLVTVQPISALVFIRSYLKSTFSKLSWILIPMVDRMNQWVGGYHLDEMTPLPACKDVHLPVLFIQGKHDPWTELSDLQSFYDAIPGEKELLWVDEKIPRFEVYNRIGQQPQPVLEFLHKYL